MAYRLRDKTTYNTFESKPGADYVSDNIQSVLSYVSEKGNNTKYLKQLHLSRRKISYEKISLDEDLIEEIATACQKFNHIISPKWKRAADSKEVSPYEWGFFVRLNMYPKNFHAISNPDYEDVEKFTKNNRNCVMVCADGTVPRYQLFVRDVQTLAKLKLILTKTYDTFDISSLGIISDKIKKVAGE